MKKIFSLLLSVSTLTAVAQTYFLNGDAQAIGNDCYQLTGLSTAQNGTVWYADQIDLLQPFDLQFLMNYGDLDGNGADGICFVLQTVGTDAIGTEGGGLGYLNFGTSLGIEFDTWQNGEYGDPVEDHIAIEMNGDINHNSAANIAGPIQADALDVNIEDGEDHVVRIVWNPDDQIIQVYFDCVFRLSGEIDLINSIFGGENMVYWGFTAATGGSFNNQTVCLQESILNQTEELTVCTGASVTLNAGASSDGIYTWTPDTNLSDPTSGSPVCTPPASTSYTVTFNDLCNVPAQLTFDITVEDLAVNVSGIETINCVNTSSSIDAQLNLDLDAQFTWSYQDVVVATGVNLDNITTPAAGEYLLAVNVQNACFAEVAFEVPVDTTTFEVSAGDDQTLNCYNSTAGLQGSYNGNGGLIAWAYNGNTIGGENALTLDATQSGEYTLIITHPNSGCTSTDDVVVNSDFSTPDVSIGDQDSLTCIFPVVEIVNVSIASAHDYTTLWTTAEGSFVGGQNIPQAFVNAPGSYTLTVQDTETGCTDAVTVYVGISENYQVDLSTLTFPNVITSNGDSKNEKWQPFLRHDPGTDLSSIFGVYDLQIYNRWGNVVFSSASFNSAWTGRDQEPGTYYYLLKYETLCDNGKKGDVKGFVELLK